MGNTRRGQPVHEAFEWLQLAIQGGGPCRSYPQRHESLDRLVHDELQLQRKQYSSYPCPSIRQAIQNAKNLKNPHVKGARTQDSTTWYMVIQTVQNSTRPRINPTKAISLVFGPIWNTCIIKVFVETLAKHNAMGGICHDMDKANAQITATGMFSDGKVLNFSWFWLLVRRMIWSAGMYCGV